MATGADGSGHNPVSYDLVSYDHVSATLVIDEPSFDELTELVAVSDEPVDWEQRWSTAGVISDGQVEPAVAAMATASADAVRHIVVERVSGELADQMLVAWDTGGRVAISRRVAEDRLMVQASSFEVLPVLLSQHLRLLRAWETALTGRQAVDATASAVNALLTPAAEDARGPVSDAGSAPDHGLTDAIGAVDLAWRVSAGWKGHDPDVSLIGLSAASGHWIVELAAGGRVAAADGSASTKAVRLIPVSVTQAVNHLGTVVSGRNGSADTTSGP